jgi:hypothetical protein
MTLQALASAIDLFSAPAADRLWPTADSAGCETHEALKDYNAALADMIRARKAKAVEQKNSSNASFRTVARENPELAGQALAQLGETIAKFEALIENSKATLVGQQVEADELLAQAASISVANARPARRAVNKFFELGGDLHNETVEFYYFLLALRAEYDPDARGGPSFDDPKPLGDLSARTNQGMTIKVTATGAFLRDLKRLGKGARQDDAIAAVELFVEKPTLRQFEFRTDKKPKRLLFDTRQLS